MSVTINDLEAKAKELIEARARSEEAKAASKVANEAEEKIEQEFMALLETAEIASYKSKVANITICRRESVKFPKELEEKRAFAQWAQEQGIYEEIYSVNSQTLNSLYKKEKEASEAKGELFFRIPGLGDPSIMTYLSVRKV